MRDETREGTGWPKRSADEERYEREVNRRVGRQLRAWRERAGLTLRSVSERFASGWPSAPYLSKVESGKLQPPRTARLILLTHAYDVELDEFMRALLTIQQEVRDELFGGQSSSDQSKREKRLIEDTFTYLLKIEDFPVSDLPFDADDLRDAAVKAKYAMIRQYEIRKGLNVLPHDVLRGNHGTEEKPA